MNITIYTSHTVLHIVLIHFFKKMNIEEYSTPPCYEMEVYLKIRVHTVEFHSKNAILPHCKYSCGPGNWSQYRDKIMTKSKQPLERHR
jgi:hypothetical protein